MIISSVHPPKSGTKRSPSSDWIVRRIAQIGSFPLGRSQQIHIVSWIICESYDRFAYVCQVVSHPIPFGHSPDFEDHCLRDLQRSDSAFLAPESVAKYVSGQKEPDLPVISRCSVSIIFYEYIICVCIFYEYIYIYVCVRYPGPRYSVLSWPYPVYLSVRISWNILGV